MVEEKALIVGASGFIGSKFAKLLSDRELFLTYYKHPIKGTNAFRLNAVDRAGVARLIRRTKPDLIIDVHGMNPQYCEKFPGEAWDVNVTGSLNILEAAKNVGSKYLFISSDLVFGGEKAVCTEEDAPSPLNQYGLHKAVFEEIAKFRYWEDSLIIRTSVTYGVRGDKLNWPIVGILKGIKSRKLQKLGLDTFNPILVEDLVRIARDLHMKGANGIFNVAGRENMNWLEFGTRVADCFGFDSKHLKGVPPEEYRSGIRYPLRSNLSSRKFEKVLGRHALPIDRGLKIVKEQLESL